MVGIMILLILHIVCLALNIEIATRSKDKFVKIASIFCSILWLACITSDIYQIVLILGL